MNRIFVFFAALFLIAAPASAQSAPDIVEDAKAAGVVGERADGYLGYVQDTVDERILDAVEEINIKRRAAYTRLAEQEGVSIDVVARLTAEELIANRVESGEYYMNADGQWVRKD